MYGGCENCFKDMTRLDVWNKTCKSVRKANESDLNLMMMRTSRKQKIKRKGVYITVRGEQLWFMKQPQTIQNLEREVYVRYDPADLRTARIYDAETDRYLFTWELADMLLVDFITNQKDEVSDAEELIRRTSNFIHEQAKGVESELLTEQRITMLDMTVRKARANKNDNFIINMPKNIVPIMSKEETDIQKASGDECQVPINLKTIMKNAKKKNGDF